MTGCIRTQCNLIAALADYQSAEELAGMFPAWGEEADRRHARLAEIAMACGFEPGRAHHHLTIVEWAEQRAAVIRRVFPQHVKERR